VSDRSPLRLHHPRPRSRPLGHRRRPLVLLDLRPHGRRPTRRGRDPRRARLPGAQRAGPERHLGRAEARRGRGRKAPTTRMAASPTAPGVSSSDGPSRIRSEPDRGGRSGTGARRRAPRPRRAARRPVEPRRWSARRPPASDSRRRDGPSDDSGLARPPGRTTGGDGSRARSGGLPGGAGRPRSGASGRASPPAPDRPGRRALRRGAAGHERRGRGAASRAGRGATPAGRGATGARAGRAHGGPLAMFRHSSSASKAS